MRSYSGIFTVALGILAIASTLIACGSRNQAQLADVQSPCPTGMAQILVGDSFQRIICGCQEAAGTVVHLPTSLTCTVPAGTTFLFNAAGTQLAHQIVSTAVPAGFPASPPGFVSFGFSLGTVGNYPYQDAYNPQIRGTLVVQ